MIAHGHPGHPAAAAAFAADGERRAWHDQTLWMVRSRRDRAVSGVSDWEALRDRAQAIKRHVATHLDELLDQFEANCQRNGITVHWAADAAEHNRIVHGLLAERGVTRLVKSKSMLTEECGLNPFLEERGIEVVDTDLGERIVQLRHEPPSHIVLPAIHVRKAEIGDLFEREMGSPAGLDDPTRLTRIARADLRPRFLAAQAGLTGVNFAIADRGGIVVCTNEGNADLGTSLPPLHIACMGIEKILPRLEDLGVFTRLLARSATGQAITSYTAHCFGPRPGGEMHVVIVDNGRSRILAKPEYRAALACIRCGACLNTCPVYRRSGGHSYGSVIPGPIGSVLSPHLAPAQHHTLPYASTLCGSCTDVCPAKIDLHHQLLAWRRDLVEAGHAPWRKRLVMAVGGAVLARPFLYRLGSQGAKFVNLIPRFALPLEAKTWLRDRELPPQPPATFHEMWHHRPKSEGQIP